MGGIFSSRERNKFGEALFISSKLRNACWMLSSIPELRTMFIQYLKDKKWVTPYLDSMHVDLDDVDENISMAVKYNFPPELLDLFPGAETFLHNHISPQTSPLPPNNKHLTNNNAGSVYSFEESFKEENKDKEKHPNLASIQSSLFLSTSSLMSHSSFSNSTVIQSAIQQELKLLIIAGILLIFVESSEYKNWLRHHMSLVTFSELCQQELEHSWRSIRSNFIPKGSGMKGSAHRYIKHQNRSSLRKKSNVRHASPRKGKIFVSSANTSSPQPASASTKLKQQQSQPDEENSRKISSEEEVLQKQFKEYEEQRLKRQQRHKERIKKMIFAALSIPFAGGQALKNVLATSDWLDSLVHFLQFLPVGVGVSSSSASLYNREKSTFPSSSSVSTTTTSSGIYCCCETIREDCPILYVNRHVEKVTEMARDDIVGHNLCHFLATKYQQNHVPSSNYSPKHRKERRFHSSSNAKNVDAESTVIQKSEAHNPNDIVDNAPFSVVQSKHNNLSIDTKQLPLETSTTTKKENKESEVHGATNIDCLQKDVILRELRALELRQSEPDRPLYFTFRLLHRDGLVYWHLIKCLPIHHPVCGTNVSDTAMNAETSTNDNLTCLDYSSATSNYNASVYSSNDPRIREYNEQNNYGAQQILVVPPLGLLDISEKSGHSPNGAYHVLSTHIVLPDLSQNSSVSSLPTLKRANHSRDNINANNNNSNHYTNSCHSNYQDTENSTQFASHNASNMYYANSQSKTRFTEQDMEQLARDLQMIDDFLLVLSVLFQK